MKILTQLNVLLLRFIIFRNIIGHYTYVAYLKFFFNGLSILYRWSGKAPTFFRIIKQHFKPPRFLTIFMAMNSIISIISASKSLL